MFLGVVEGLEMDVSRLRGFPAVGRRWSSTDAALVVAAEVLVVAARWLLGPDRACIVFVERLDGIACRTGSSAWL